MAFLAKLVRLWAILFAVVGVVMLILLIGGHYGESQFSPDSFETRGVSCYYIPQTNLEVLRWPGKPYRMKIVQFWIDNGYLPETSPRAKRWDVISGWHPLPRQIYSGSAKAFCYKAGCNTDEMADEWINWSRQHPDLADKLWPEVVSLLARGGYSYTLAGLLMNGVDKTPDPKAFETAFAAYREYAEAVRKELEESGNP